MKIHKKEEKYIVSRSREGFPSPAYWNLISQTQPNKLYGCCFSEQIVISESGKLTNGIPRKSWDNCQKHVVRKIFSNSSYFMKINMEVEKWKKTILKFIKRFPEDFSEYNFQKLLESAEVIQTNALAYDYANTNLRYVAIDKLIEEVKRKTKVPENIFSVLVAPKHDSYAKNMEKDLVKCAIKALNNKNSIIKEGIYLSNKYGWIPFGYDGPTYWDSEHFIKILKKKIKNNSEKLNTEYGKIILEENNNRKKFREMRKKYKLPTKISELLDIISIGSSWMDERKEYTYKLYYLYAKILHELGKRYGVPYRNLQFVFTDELALLEKKGTKFVRDLSESRMRNKFFIYYKKGKRVEASPAVIRDFLSYVDQEKSISEIKGIVASRGNKNLFRAVVKIVLKPEDEKKIQKGDLLVAAMTNPRFIFAMKKAAGFITNEGGLTCHAAIVAREMKKPCIIGTKIATQILKDGDLVEVDADKGTIKIISEK